MWQQQKKVEILRLLAKFNHLNIPNNIPWDKQYKQLQPAAGYVEEKLEDRFTQYCSSSRVIDEHWVSIIFMYLFNNVVMAVYDNYTKIKMCDLDWFP